MMISNRMKAAGLVGGIGIFVGVGLILNSGQYVPGGGGASLRSDCNPGERLEWDGATWQCRQEFNDYRSKHVEWTDEYMMNGCSVSAPCGSLFSTSATGTGAGTSFLATTSRPGIITLTTGSTSTGRSSLTTASNTLDFGSYTQTIFEATVGFPSLSNVTDEYAAVIGIADNPTVLDQIDGCYFGYDRAGTSTDPTTGADGTGDKWKIWCSSNSVRTEYILDGSTVSDNSFTTVSNPVAALTLPSTNIYDLKIVVTTVTGTPTEADFYVNGVKSGVITSHLPSGSTRVSGGLILMLKSAGTTSVSMAVDRTRLAIDLATARSL